MTELLISGGTLVDGTGEPGRPGSLVFSEGRLLVLEPDTAPPATDRVIDASGLIVAPGFIDLHSHSGLWLLHDGSTSPRCDRA